MAKTNNEGFLKYWNPLGSVNGHSLCNWLVIRPCIRHITQTAAGQAECLRGLFELIKKKETITRSQSSSELNRKPKQSLYVTVCFVKLCSRCITHPSESVGVRSSEQGMENDDCFIQIPNEHALRKERAKSMAHSACKMIWLSIGRVHRFMCPGICRRSPLMVTKAPRNCGKSHHQTIHLLPLMH